MFSEYCMNEFNSGNCEPDNCEWCPVNQAYNKIFSNNFVLEDAVEKTLEQYDSENIDIVADNENECIDIMYHSDSNSFCVVENVCNTDDYSNNDIEYVANLYGVGYVL